jgi:hypothetical protein
MDLSGKMSAQIRSDERTGQNVHDHRRVRQDEIQIDSTQSKEKRKYHCDETDKKIDNDGLKGFIPE